MRSVLSWPDLAARYAAERLTPSSTAARSTVIVGGSSIMSTALCAALDSISARDERRFPLEPEVDPTLGSFRPGALADRLVDSSTLNAESRWTGP
jgi:hypothetical protein